MFFLWSVSSQVYSVLFSNSDLQSSKIIFKMIRNPAKALLRAQIKKRMTDMTPEARKQQSKAILEKLLKLPAFQTSTRVSVYLSMDVEVNTLPIIEELFKRDKHVFVPTYNKNVMEMVRLHCMDDYKSLPMTKWKIKQPDQGDRENALQTGGLDLILLPGVAFTTEGGRCGHGMGYYDKFLQRLLDSGCSRDKVLLVGLAFKEQIVDAKELPIDKTDILLDQVMTSD